MGTPRLQEISLAAIRTTAQNPRSDLAEDDELRGLAASLGPEGAESRLVEPPVVEQMADGGYRILAGERRIQAARLAQWERIPCLVHEPLDPARAHTLRLIENLHRQELHPLDKAAGLKIAWLTANADALDLGKAAREILAVEQPPGETLAALEHLLAAHGFVRTHPAVPWEAVLDRLGVALSPSKRKRLLRVLGIDSEVQARVRDLAISEAGLRALGQMAADEQTQVVAAIEETPELARQVRRISRAVRDQDYTVADALAEARGEFPKGEGIPSASEPPAFQDDPAVTDTVLALVEASNLLLDALDALREQAPDTGVIPEPWKSYYLNTIETLKDVLEGA